MMQQHDIFTACIGVLYLYILAWYGILNNHPKEYLLPGSLPKDLFNESFFGTEIPRKGRIMRFYVNEIENYQFKIETNTELNEGRWTVYIRTVRYLLFLPLILLVCYFATS
jgi:hypothetical protein